MSACSDEDQAAARYSIKKQPVCVNVDIANPGPLTLHFMVTKLLRDVCFSGYEFDNGPEQIWIAARANYAPEIRFELVGCRDDEHLRRELGPQFRN